jgi:tRNA threonylcarbamoyladenosine biosynthesis protein TsaE
MGEKPKMKTFYVLSRREEDTYRIAVTVASHLRIGDILILSGDLACGKTYFAKGLAAALGSTDIVTSPTYALVHTYNTMAGDLMHIDAYRLSGIHEFRDLGLEEYLLESIAAIEWGDKVAAVFDDYLSIAFHLADADINHRLLTFTCSGERWATEMVNLREGLGGSEDEPRTRY